MEQQRPFFRATVGELESLYRQHPYNKKVLTKLEKELALRKAKAQGGFMLSSGSALTRYGRKTGGVPSSLLLSRSRSGGQ